MIKKILCYFGFHSTEERAKNILILFLLELIALFLLWGASKILGGFYVMAAISLICFIYSIYKEIKND